MNNTYSHEVEEMGTLLRKAAAKEIMPNLPEGLLVDRLKKQP